MRYDTPENAQLLEDIHNGCVKCLCGADIQLLQSLMMMVSRNAPPHIMNVALGQPVQVHVDKRVNEKYVPPKGVKAFTGSGNRLGAPVPSLTTAAEASAIADRMPGSFEARQSGSSSSAQAAAPRDGVVNRFEVDQTSPTTSVQIRLADGTRLVFV